MSLKGPIVIIDDDVDDQDMIGAMLEELALVNPSRYFENGQAALDYLLTTPESPLLILCDINMPVMNGLELRDQIDGDPYLKKKSIPFIFLTTSDSPVLVRKAYNGTIQGYFKKCNSFQEGKGQLQLIVNYWKDCLHPNNCR
ncbi:Response regulator receiver domain-containing protein [Dyadobacter sp. SG02]|uniref:response regulator n=1 Tax=Dyadobacter sp. SG02 TaxID=1855291 RepID=UPI0008CD401A|nr:response regulator [Dyadobacter sp. SG02]SEJ37715.1 Response regulator receiver domain-containing protein [Dyadobacter sp. SG02]